MKLAAAAFVGLATAAAATAGGDAVLDLSDFRYVRTLPGTVAHGRAAVEADARLFAHAKPGFADVRVINERGATVAWRLAPEPRRRERAVPVLNTGRRAGAAVALLDLGPAPAIHDRVELRIAAHGFVGRAVVLGSDRRRGPFTRLSATGVYDLAGAERARSTTAVFPPTDFRYLEVRVTGVPRVAGATVSSEAARRLVPRPHTTRAAVRDRASVLALDLGFPRVPVSELVVRAATPAYDRPVRVAGSNDRRTWRPLASGRLFRFRGSRSAPLAVDSRSRFLRVEIDNGDDEPLHGVRVDVRGPSHAIFVEPGHRPPLRLLYGAADARAPDYEFARLPVAPPGRILPASALGPERRNPAFTLPGRSFGERHGWIVDAALAGAALAVGVAAFLVFQRRA